MYFLLLWQSTCKVSDSGIEWLLQFVSQFFKLLSELISSEYLTELVIIFPSSLYLLRKFVKFDCDIFTKFAVCPKCTKLYDMKDCTEIDRYGNRVIRHCQHRKFPRSRVCGTPLARRVLLSNGHHEFYPHKVYCYNSVIEKLEEMVSRKDFPQQCEAWRQLEREDGYLADIIDGQIWKDFQTHRGKAFLSMPRNYMFMLNFDFFQPKKHRHDYSVGVLIYLANLNLPRRLRFKWENIIVVGIIPGLDHAPASLHEFLHPFVKEMTALWNGVYMTSCLSNIPLCFRAAVVCVACDIPAARKLCGFKNPNSHYGCAKCFKYFPGNVKDSFDYSGFDRSQWPKRNMEMHRRHANLLQKSVTKSRHDSLSREYGIYYSALLDLEYFDAIRYTVVDPMHNLFLGTAKTMYKLWVQKGILSKQNILEIDKKIKGFDVGTGLGRIPHKLSSNYGCYTASQWKNWTLVFSSFVLKGILPVEHFQCWQSFVLGCKFLVRPVISVIELEKADLMLLQFCKKFERLYGTALVKPNMHLHAHIKECVLDYGPIYNFWCFSFERYNGILGSFKTNNRCIEIQLMRKLLAGHFVSSTILPNEFQDSLLSIMLKDIDESTVDFTELGPKLVKSSLGADLFDIDWEGLENNISLPKFFKVKTLDRDELAFLLSVYQTMYGDSVSDVKTLALSLRKYGHIIIGKEKFGSRLECRSLRTARITASWAGDNGEIDISHPPRPGRVCYFIQHGLQIDSRYRQHVFAIVDWYCRDEEKDMYGKPVEIWKSSFIPGGPARFLPVARIAFKFVVAYAELGGRLVIVPLNRTFC